MTEHLTKRLFTIEELERMDTAEVFHPDERLELIRGEIMSAPVKDWGHAAVASRLITLLIQVVGNNALVWPQNHIGVPPYSLPQPDASLLNWRGDFYRHKRPTPEDVLLVVEVDETSADYDRDVKGPLYAQAGIPEYWIVNLQENVIELYTTSAEGAYQHVRKVRRGDTLALPAELGAVGVSDILGKEKEIP